MRNMATLLIFLIGFSFFWYGLLEAASMGLVLVGLAALLLAEHKSMPSGSLLEVLFGKDEPPSES